MIHCLPSHLIGARECKADYAASVRGIMPLRPWGDESLPPSVSRQYAYCRLVFRQKALDVSACRGIIMLTLGIGRFCQKRDENG